MSVSSDRDLLWPPPSGTDSEAIRTSFLARLLYSQVKHPISSTVLDRFLSLAFAVRDRLAEKWIETQARYYLADTKRVYYLSAEFLMGRALYNNMINLGVAEACDAALKSIGFDLAELLEEEHDAGLGNGGLGRLAACFLDSMATLGIPGYGYGIRYEFGIFDQLIRDGWQVEQPDEWLRNGNPWEVRRPEYTVTVKFGGRTERYEEDGKPRVRWVDTSKVMGVPFDTPIAGFGGRTVNNLRLWRARASAEFDLQMFNQGDYEKAVLDKTLSETISAVLYPTDKFERGRELRFKQQYFFVACALADIIRRHLAQHKDLRNLPDKAAIQLNDTHPSIAIPELMRIFIDEQGMEWDDAWAITTRTFGYTNHTIMAEGLEKWPVTMFGNLLPRHLEIVFEINRRFLRDVSIRWPGDVHKLANLSLVEEAAYPGDPKKVRMAYLAVVGSHKVNGVAELHTKLLKTQLLPDFNELFPDRFVNVTNGVTPRRWLMSANPELARAITKRVGSSWMQQLDDLSKLAPLANDAGFRGEVRAIKLHNKEKLAAWIKRELAADVDPASMFDVQIKRIHEYKRQLLNLLQVIARYQRIKAAPDAEIVSRTVMFAGKAAPAYVQCKLIIKLINSVAQVVNNDPAVRGRLKLLFLPNYSVSLAERVIPAADLSEQISTAGKEASGTGNMKLALNGALTIGTLDGANVEIRDRVGADNFFLFGLSTDEVLEHKRRGHRPRDFYDSQPMLRAVIDAISSGQFSPGDSALFRPIVDELLQTDQYMLMADFDAYVKCQDQVDAAWRNADDWTRKAILNIAQMGTFSSDRSIRDYTREIWDIKPLI
jgi:starch phosphorylase